MHDRLLRVRTFRLGLGDPALFSLAEREADRDARCGKESNRDERPDHNAGSVAANELSEFVGRARRTGKDRLVGQVALDVHGQAVCLLELGMMTGPPMARMVGLFGYNYAWPQLFLLTLVAHVVFGITMGLLIQHFLTDDDRSWLIPFVLRPIPGAAQ